MESRKPRGWYIGKRFGSLFVVRKAAAKNGARVVCRCDCGKEFEAKASNVTTGRTTSCGCSQRVYGEHERRTVNIFHGMRSRCRNESDPRFKHYGGRGIRVCERWETADDFIADMGLAPDGYSIERLDVDGDYCPSNCMWIPAEQQPENRRDSVRVEHGGRLRPLSSLAREHGVSLRKVKKRLEAGHTLDMALSSEPLKRGPRGPWKHKL